MDDNRQAAIEYFQRIIDATNTDGRYNLGFIDGLEFCINHLSTMPSAQPEQKKGKKFIEIVAEYSAICTYPEYEGKPYFSIRYEENGEEFEGFGTYKPEVLTEYIREYFMGEKKGKWVEDEAHSVVICSQCNASNLWKSPCCPYCGANMEEE